ncbi:hypothetical protein F4604DRAFT_1927627 [Suillus subluteus]|nr:hypothetical protein F4604DRAFT_1927627 [Suillus subluteus]
MYDGVSITACKISKTDLDKIELLDKAKNNWTSWSESMLEIFSTNLIEGYTLGTVTCPIAQCEPVAARNWDLNNAGIIAALRNCISHDDKCTLDRITLAHELLNVHYSKATSLSETSHCLTEGVHSIFDMGIPMQQVFLSIIMLNALSGDLSHVCDQVASLPAGSTLLHPFTPNDICTCLDIEQEGNPRPAPPTRGLVAPTACIVAMEPLNVLWRKRDAAANKPDTTTKKSNNQVSSTKPTHCTDSSGRAYLLDSTTGEAFYLATSSIPAPTTPSEEFENLEANVDWHVNQHPIYFVGLTVDAPNQTTCTPIDLLLFTPFFLDSGASVHISHNASDFYELHCLLPHPICGISGLQIEALGIGSIRLCIAKGMHITLHHVLFVLAATVCLISVSFLCADGHYVAHLTTHPAGNIAAEHQCSTSTSPIGVVTSGSAQAMYSSPLTDATTSNTDPCMAPIAPEATPGPT